jgi:uncharacterized protein YbcC (UPF0753/DUF2309 family)
MIENKYLTEVISSSCSKVAPAWPLKNSVAVNPFLGLADLSFNQAAKVLQDRSNIKMCMPIDFYLDQVKQEIILNVDISAALNKHNQFETKVEDFLDKAKSLATAENTKEDKLKTILEAAEDLTSKHWHEFFIDKVSFWTAAYFDENQALWNTTAAGEDIFKAWKREGEVDRSTELIGLKNFRNTLKSLPDEPLEAAKIVLDKLDIPKKMLEAYLHTLLLKIVGWSSYIAGKDWNNNLYGGNTDNLKSFLSILLAWELCIYESHKGQGIEELWKEYKASYITHQTEGKDDTLLNASLLLQESFDLALQRQLTEKFKTHQPTNKTEKRPKAQAVFCIDVRSEVYRRSLEQVDADIETIGFAGFFGFPINYVPLAHAEGKKQCPVLIPTGLTVYETLKHTENVDTAVKKRKGKHQVAKNWKLFKSGAISSFGFVSPLGLSFLPKLLSDSFGLTRPTEDPNKDGLNKWLRDDRDIDISHVPLKDKINMAASALTAMGLSEKMAPLVLITGHGSTSVNNPHATGLDCGACGGHSGEINAMTAEKILNDRAVRSGLMEKDIFIPIDTHFIACLHDTTTDEIRLIGESNIPNTHTAAINEIKRSLKTASLAARLERGDRMNIEAGNIEASIIKRSKDWSQVRPEYGLAGCHSFIIAPRERTTGMDLGGKSFLHSYEWEKDTEFKILETIMTAPMVVTSWINLQYFASTVDNDMLGAGNKTLHNVSGGIGVIEGAAGDLRIGLPFQSIHDGEKYQHLPQRLNVIIEAPMDEITKIVQKHEMLKNLCDNEWITLLLLNEDGNIDQKYVGNGAWENITASSKIITKKKLVTV